MACTQQKQLVSFPKVRIQKEWFRYFNNHKDFRNEGTLHLFSLMALYSYADFRSNRREIDGQIYLESPGQWICKVSSLPRILRVHSKDAALELMRYFRDAGLLDFEMLDADAGLLRFSIADWKRHCVNLNYNYYSYKGSGFFFFPLPVGRQLLKAARKAGGLLFSELDAIMDLWLHTILNDDHVAGSEYMPVVYYKNMKGQPLLSYSYLSRRWGWSKSRVGRFVLRLEETGIISRVSFSSSRGTVISMCRYREMIYGEDCEKLNLSRIGEILGIAEVVEPLGGSDIEMSVQARVPTRPQVLEGGKSLRIQVFRVPPSSFFARPTPLIFFSSIVWGNINSQDGLYRGPPNSKKGGSRHADTRETPASGTGSGGGSRQK